MCTISTSQHTLRMIPSGYILWLLTLKHRSQEKPPSPRYVAGERAGDHGSQRSLKARTPSERASTAPDTSEGTLIGSPIPAQPSIEHSRAISTENPRKRGGPSGPRSISPERPSPRSGSRARYVKSRSSGQKPIERDPECQIANHR